MINRKVNRQCWRTWVVKVLEIPEHEGARRSEVGKSVLDAFKGWPLRPF